MYFLGSMVDLVYVFFFPYIFVSLTLGGVCINVASSTVHPFIVLCLTSWEQSTFNATLQRNSPRAMYDSECWLFVPSMTREDTHPLWAVSWNCPGWANLSSYLSSYLDVFSERLVIKLFCIYCHLNTQIISFYVFMWFFFLWFLSSSISTHQ